MLIADLETDEDNMEYDFSVPEDVFIEVIKDPSDHRSWKKLSIEFTSVMPGDNQMSGAASFENDNGFLDYTIEDMCEEPISAGYYICEHITAVYYKGDGYVTDDDMDFDCKRLRPATQEEIDEYL